MTRIDNDKGIDMFAKFSLLSSRQLSVIKLIMMVTMRVIWVQRCLPRRLSPLPPVTLRQEISPLVKSWYVGQRRKEEENNRNQIKTDYYILSFTTIFKTWKSVQVAAKCARCGGNKYIDLLPTWTVDHWPFVQNKGLNWKGPWNWRKLKCWRRRGIKSGQKLGRRSIPPGLNPPGLRYHSTSAMLMMMMMIFHFLKFALQAYDTRFPISWWNIMMGAWKAGTCWQAGT